MDAKEDTWPSLDSVPAAQGSISSPALLLYLGLLSPIGSSYLSVLPASTTLVVPTFFPHMLAHCCYRASASSPPYLPLAPCFSSTLPRTPEGIGSSDPRVSLTTFQAASKLPTTTLHPLLRKGPVPLSRPSLPPRRLSPLLWTFAASPLSPHFLSAPPLSPSWGNSYTLPHSSCRLAASHLRLGSAFLPGSPCASPPSVSPVAGQPPGPVPSS